jgi:nitroreductase
MATARSDTRTRSAGADAELLAVVRDGREYAKGRLHGGLLFFPVPWRSLDLISGEKSMLAIDALLTRSSAKTLGRKNIPPEHLQIALEAAVRAPDHGRLRPWRFMVIEGDALRHFGEVLAKAAKLRNPQASDAEITRERDKALRAPHIIVVACRIVTSAKVPEVEQILAAGAAASNLMLALHAQGYGAMWKTGLPAYDPTVKTAIGLAATDHIIGFIYAGDDPEYSPAKRASVSEAMLQFNPS